ncbi:MAG TPA: VOC family protein [Bryobacteraceae bacterium]|nr:VOC family protein [Bryobacteraceae bacterium]
MTVIPSLRYKDAPAAIEWLCRAFGFEKNAVYPNPDGTIAHAQLTLGKGMIMLGSVSDNGYGRMMKQPFEIGGANTHGIYLVVKDPDAVCNQAKAAGAEMAMDIEDKEYGGRGFTCKDPEGHLWSVGNYDPWQT